MINYWWVTRPKRKLNSIPSVLATFVEVSLDAEWQGQRNTHLLLEETLERDEIKRHGIRRDQGGGGARTYAAWLLSLGLIFTQETTNRVQLTLAGEAIINGDNPVTVLKNQILKYQFPSAFSIRRGVKVSDRFRIRPFLFLLRLLSDSRIRVLTEEEIAKIIITEAENEDDECFEHVVNRVLEFREFGDNCLAADFFEKYKPSRANVNQEYPFERLFDVANTLVNWLEYTQLIERESKTIRIIEDRFDEVTKILTSPSPLIDRPESHEYFQRKFGVDPNHRKDTRNLEGSRTITGQMIIEQQIRRAFLEKALATPIVKISANLAEYISERTGLDSEIVLDTLYRFYPQGAIGGFLANYFDMAFKGFDQATNFEKATVELFQEIFGFQATHVGPLGKTPDVLILSSDSNYQAIIDNKAYRSYSISNDHYNRMVHNYIGGFSEYSDSLAPLSFFLYIAGGFSASFDKQLNSIVRATNLDGSGISVSRMIELVDLHRLKPYSHDKIRELFSCGRQVKLQDMHNAELE